MIPENGELERRYAHRPTSPPSTAPGPSLLFYKLIVPSILQAKRLRIPKKFVKRFGDRLSAETTFTLPNGGVWHVGLIKSDNKFWFFHGWHEFMEYHSIHVGCLLIFRYEGNSNFGVNIFDLTAAEINYPSNNPRYAKGSCDGKQCAASGGEETNDDVEDDETSCSAPRVSFVNTIFDECVAQQSSSIDCNESLPLEKEGDDLQATSQSNGRDVDSRKLTDPKCEVGSPCLDEAIGEADRTQAKGKMNELDANESLAQQNDQAELPKTSKQRWRAVTVEERKQAIHAAKQFRSGYPFCRVILRQSYVNERFPLYMPRRFAEKYLCGLLGALPRLITLQSSNGKQWSVRCMNSGRGIVKLSKGWTEFVRDNNLEEGDVCVFELIGIDDVVLKVSIFCVLEHARVENRSERLKATRIVDGQTY